MVEEFSQLDELTKRSLKTFRAPSSIALGVLDLVEIILVAMDKNNGEEESKYGPPPRRVHHRNPKNSM